MDESNELVEARVLVPRARLAEFYDLLSRWLREDRDVLTHKDEFLGLSESGIMDELPDTKARRSWVEGVEVGRIADAINVYDRLSPGAKKILDALLDHPVEEISGESLAARLNLSQDKLTGTLASIALRCQGVDRDVPYRYTAGSSGGIYVIEPDVAKLFHAARIPTERMLEAAKNYGDAREKFRIRRASPPDNLGSYFKSTMGELTSRLHFDVFQIEVAAWGDTLMNEFRKTHRVSGEHVPPELDEQEQLEEEVQMVDAC